MSSLIIQDLYRNDPHDIWGIYLDCVSSDGSCGFMLFKFNKLRLNVNTT